MGMMMQVLSPGVQDGDQPNRGAEMPGIGGDDAQRLGGGREQDAIDDDLIVESNLGDRRRHLKTTWKYGTGNSSECRSASHSAPANPWHFGQCRLRQEL